MASLNTLYALIKKNQARRNELEKSFNGHPDREKVVAFYDREISELVSEYKERGGKRKVS